MPTTFQYDNPFIGLTHTNQARQRNGWKVQGWANLWQAGGRTSEQGLRVFVQNMLANQW
jgi:hypothetical protein